MLVDWQSEIQRRKGDKVLNHEIGKSYEYCYYGSVLCFFPDIHLVMDSCRVKEHSAATRTLAPTEFFEQARKNVRTVF